MNNPQEKPFQTNSSPQGSYFEDCDCSASIVTKRTIKGGTTVFQRQCIKCFNTVGSFLSKDAVKKMGLNNISDFDAESREKYNEYRKNFWNTQRVLKKREREKERIEWEKDYREYLRSPEWIKKRRAVLARASFTCECCLVNEATEVHHLTYKNVFHEFTGELAATCRACHQKAHGEDMP